MVNIKPFYYWVQYPSAFERFARKMTPKKWWYLLCVFNVIRRRLSADIADYDALELQSYDTSIARASVKIIEDFYCTISPTLIIVRAATVSNESFFHQSGLINEVLVRSRSSGIAVNIEDYTGLKIRQIRNCNLLFIDSYEAFR